MHPHSCGKKALLLTTFCVFLILSGCLLIYSNSLQVPFTFDDRPFIINDTAVHVKNLSIENLLKAAHDGSPKQRPLPNISFALNHYLGDLSCFGYHVTNILIHSLTGIFLFLLFILTINLAQLKIFSCNEQRWRGWNAPLNSWMTALAAALVWTLHPLHTESVTYICQRMTSLAGLFYVLSILLYVKGRLSNAIPDKISQKSKLFYLGSAAAGGLAVLSKPNAAMLPVMIFFYEWIFFQNISLEWLKRRSVWIAGIICLLGIFTFIFLGTLPIDRILSAYARRDFTLVQRVLTEFRVIIYYVSLILFPHYKRLLLDYGYPLSDALTAPPLTIISIMAIFGMLAIAAVISKKDPLTGFGILWFLVNLVIESSVIGLEIIFEHRTYLPSMFLILSLVVAFSRFCQSRRTAAVIFCLAVSILGYWSWQRNEIWRDELGLWHDCAVKSPEKVRPHYNLGCLMYQKNQPDQAIPHFYKAVELEPGSADIHYNLGCALAKKQSYSEAMAQFSKTLALDPNHADAHNNLANILSEQGKTALALAHYRQAAGLRPLSADFQFNLGDVLFSRGMIDEAITYYQKAYSLEPDNPLILNRLGYARFRQGDLSSAWHNYQKSLRLSPDNGETFGKIGDLLVEKKSYKMAIGYYIKSLEMNPNDAQSHYNLGVAYRRTDRPDLAMTHFIKAAELSPDMKIPDLISRQE